MKQPGMITNIINSVADNFQVLTNRNFNYLLANGRAFLLRDDVRACTSHTVNRLHVGPKADKPLKILIAFSRRAEKFVVAGYNESISKRSRTTLFKAVEHSDHCQYVALVDISCHRDGKDFTDVTAVEVTFVQGKVFLYVAFADSPTRVPGMRLLCTYDVTPVLDGDLLNGHQALVNLTTHLVTDIYSMGKVEHLLAFNLDNSSIVLYSDSTWVRVVSQVSYPIIISEKGKIMD